MKKKVKVFRVRKVAPKRFLVEVRRRFLFWWFYQKGCRSIGLAKYYASKRMAQTAIQELSERKNVRPVTIIL